VSKGVNLAPINRISAMSRQRQSVDRCWVNWLFHISQAWLGYLGINFYEQ